MHALAARQWVLGETPVWPDVDLVIPFSRRVIDGTGRIAAAPVSPHIEAGYTVTDTLEELTLHDLTRDVDVDPLAATWAAGPSGDTAHLHVLAGDPFTWLSSNTLGSTAHETPAVVREQRFGTGPAETLTAPRRFGDVIVDARGALLDDFTPPLSTRVLKASRLALAFEDAAGKPFPVDEVALIVLGEPKQAFDTKELLRSMPLYRDADGIALWLIALRVTKPTKRLPVALSHGSQLLVWAVRYRRAPARFCTPGRTILDPGRYRLVLSGASSAAPPDLPAPNSPVPAGRAVTWQLEQEFDVAAPDTIRPYVLAVTVGDSRLFRSSDSWNPTPYGIGFPAYRGHLLAVRFASPYVGRIFGPLRTRVLDAGSHALVLDATAAPTANSEGQTTALAAALAWAEAHDSGIAPDDEAIWLERFDAAPTDSMNGQRLAQAVEVQLLTVREGAEAVLDHWQGTLSTMTDFADHVATDQTTITISHDHEGPHRTSPCSRFVPLPLPVPMAPVARDWTTPPNDWTLPPSLASQLGALTADTPTRWLAFAAATGARFNGAGPRLPPLAGLTALPASTTVEAIVDESSRPYALWMRTPEPLDWRRVTGSLLIHHASPALGCPTALAPRPPLELELLVLPSPDASSAFLVGSLGGRPIRLPRGVVELSLSFSLASGAGIPRLRRLDGRLSEDISLVLVLPTGLDWPRPPDDIRIPRPGERTWHRPTPPRSPRTP
jgi:hypothetical protein